MYTSQIHSFNVVQTILYDTTILKADPHWQTIVRGSCLHSTIYTSRSPRISFNYWQTMYTDCSQTMSAIVDRSWGLLHSLKWRRSNERRRSSVPRSGVYFMLARKDRQTDRQTDRRTEEEKKSSMYMCVCKKRERENYCTILIHDNLSWLTRLCGSVSWRFHIFGSMNLLNWFKRCWGIAWKLENIILSIILKFGI